MLKALWNIVKIGIRAIVLVAVFIASWNFLTPYFREEYNNDGDLFRNLPDNTVDVLALGSSHVQYVISPGTMYAETGYYTYLLGSSCQPFSTSYYMLEEALKTQHPDVVIQDVFTLLPQSQVCYADGMYYKAISMMTDGTHDEAADNVPLDEETRISYKYDLYMNHGNWKTMNFHDMDSIKGRAEQPEGYNWELGYVRMEPTEFRYTPLPTYEVTEIITLSDDEKKWLDKEIALCKKENVNLIFIKSPYQINQEDTNKLAAIWKYLDQKGATHIDYIERAEELDWFMDMDGDTWHNNTWGAEIVTRDLADYIKENELVTHHKEDETFEMLMDGVVSFTAQSLMGKANVNIYRLMEQASKYPCVVLFRSLGQKRTSITEIENTMLNNIGLNHDFVKDVDQDYYAVVVDGELMQDGSEPFTYMYGPHEFRLEEDAIYINGGNYDPEIGELEIVFVGDTLGWINPVGIDYSDHFFWKKGCNSWSCE